MRLSPPRLSARRASTCIRCAAGSPTARARRGSGRRGRCASLSRIASARAASAVASRASSTLTGSGGSCLTPGACGLTRMWPLTSGGERAHDLADGRGEDVDAAHDEHVVGAPDAAHARGRAAAAARRSSGPGRDRACGSAAAAPRDAGDASARARPLAPSASSTATPVSGSISSAWTKPRAPRCMPSCSSHSPQSETPMSPMPIASVTRAPQPSSSFARKAGSPPPGSPATSTRSTLDAAEIEVALGRPLDEIGGIGGREHGGFGPEQLDRHHQPLGVPGADRDVAEAEAVEGGQRRTRHERPGVVGGDDALAGGDAGGRVARAPSPSPSCRGRSP